MSLLKEYQEGEVFELERQGDSESSEGEGVGFEEVEVLMEEGVEEIKEVCGLSVVRGQVGG